MHFRFIDLRNQLKMDAYTGKSVFRGTYTGNVLSGDTRGNLSGVNLMLRDRLWLNKADVQLQLKMLYSYNLFRVRRGKVKVNKADISVQGDYSAGKEKMIDMALSVPRFGLDELMSLLPVQYDSFLTRYRFGGSGSLNATLKGPLSDPDRMQIRSKFKLTGCSARQLKTKALLSHIQVRGEVSGTRADNFRLTLDDFTASLGKGHIRGSMQVSDLHDLLLQAKIQSELDLGALQDFIALSTVENIGGMIRTSFDAEGKLGRIRADSALHLLEFLKKGTFVFQDAGIRLKQPEWSLQHITGKATLNTLLYLDSLSLTFNENILILNGKVQNLNSYILDKGILNSDLTIHTDHFSINNFLRNQPDKASRKGKEPGSFFPRRMHLNARLHAGVFDAGKFRAEDLNLKLSLVGDSMYIPSFSLAFPDGLITGNALISQNREQILSVNCNSVSKQIDIRQLFTSFNNFAQHFIMDKNVKGKLNGTISFFVQWDASLHYLSESLKAKADIEIVNGELVQFEPMLKLSKYIKVDELQLIRFNTMKNEVYISDRLVTIPEMDIHSSAFNISVSGQQTFDNVFDYRLKVLLSEVLFNKARKKKKEMDEFQQEENPEDQTTIPLIIAGTPDNYEVKFDSKRAFDLNRKNLTKSNPGSGEGNFKIEWDEKAKEPDNSEKSAAGKDQDEFTIEWEEETDGDNNF
jgi:hypothetical protein